MWARYKASTRELLHWSTVPFTIRPGPGEADRELPDGTKLPGRLNLTRLTTDLSGLVVDDTLKTPREVSDENRSAASKAILTAARGNNVGTMPLAELTQIVIVIGQRLGIIDGNGDVI